MPAAARITTALERMADGNFAGPKSVGGGVLECRIDFGPGYPIYFGRDGGRLTILLAGGTKQGQAVDIRRAKAYWASYKQRKRHSDHGAH